MYLGRLPETFLGRMNHHASVRHTAQWAVELMSLLIWGLSCCRAAWGGLCACAAQGGEQFQGVPGGQDVCDPLFHLPFEQKLLEGQSPTSLAARGPGAAGRVAAWWLDPCAPGPLWGLCPSCSASLAPGQRPQCLWLTLK